MSAHFERGQREDESLPSSSSSIFGGSSFPITPDCDTANSNNAFPYESNEGAIDGSFSPTIPRLRYQLGSQEAGEGMEAHMMSSASAYLATPSSHCFKAIAFLPSAIKASAASFVGAEAGVESA